MPYRLITVFIYAFLIVQVGLVNSQEVPILGYNINANGQVELRVSSTQDNYYILKVRNHVDSAFNLSTLMVLGQENETILVEPLEALPIDHYQVLEYDKTNPFDSDQDGINDIEEFKNQPNQGPINAAFELSFDDGSVTVDSFSTFKKLSLRKDEIQWSEFLNGKEFVKFLIINNEQPEVFFIHSENHNLHADFANEVGIDFVNDKIIKGQIIYHPASISNNGTVGTFAFNYSNGKPNDFKIVQRTHELLASNMSFIENNLSYFVTEKSKDQYTQDEQLYHNSRVAVLFEEDIFAGVDYWGINQEEGFGFFRHMSLDEIPGPLDVVLYESIPNSLPRVGGIITSVIQTPLSHVNLRAIQNMIPNAFIRDPLTIDSIASLLDDYIYFKVEQDRYVIRKATQDEVNDWHEALRPPKEQYPPLNLDYKSILPLDEISFKMYDGFGAKCANVATMRTFDFPENTTPDGFGVPFYFYQEFMKFNNFFELIENTIEDAAFKADRKVRDQALKDLRKKIKKADMPQWMLDDLEVMHNSFPQNTSIRCRSSSNNEDLEGFNGAGLYDSKTQHPDEGHISKSIKQVFASLWNLRAFEERDFYRINHLTTSMGVLCHPNYSEERANGVGVSIDPLYNTINTFYLNTQLGEDLITNPDTNSIPEEILLDKDLSGEIDFIVIQNSNLVPQNTNVLSDVYLKELGEYLTIIHDKFATLYDAVGNDKFAMDIEYKITKEDQLIIKQARPWVHFNQVEDSTMIKLPFLLNVFPSPAHQTINIACNGCAIDRLTVYNYLGQNVKELDVNKIKTQTLSIPIEDLPVGAYLISAYKEDGSVLASRRFVKI